MNHAFVFGSGCESAQSLEEHLWAAGFHSILWARDDAEIHALLREIRPSLVVITPGAMAATTPPNLYRLSDETRAPVIVAGADMNEALKCLGPTAPDRSFTENSGAVSAEHMHPTQELARAA